MIGLRLSLFGVWVAGGDASGVGVVAEVVRPGVTRLGAGAGGALGVGVVLVGVLRDLLIEVKADAVGHAGDGITAGFVGPFRFLDEGGAGFVEAVGRRVFQVVVFVFEPVTLGGDAAEAIDVVVAVTDLVVLVGVRCGADLEAGGAVVVKAITTVVLFRSWALFALSRSWALFRIRKTAFSIFPMSL